MADRTRRSRGGEPVYKRIAAEIRDEIVSGALSPGDRVPSESELMARFGVARMTVRQGLAELRAEGLVVAEHGRGVFVRGVERAEVERPTYPQGRPAMAVARNIVNQVLDEAGTDVATRQRINDDCDQFVAWMVDSYATSLRSRRH